MKKFIIPTVAALLIGGVLNAQTTAAKPVHASTITSTKPVAKKPNTTTSVAPKPASQPTVTNKTTSTIRRKHHHKPTKKAKQK